ncbi:hypothetical protein MKW98_030202 [Papaver atlanticum]|uniref:Uncharacterized protein n=1 Tax=Papaver atlanticum TaxID=357466 RepID=A0AAD4SRB1_9MAGN|nr:hypothetical protein MKW98_030202 [Papaver atlanticum]
MHKEIPTGPEKYLGEIETWDKAESALAEALDEFSTPWKIEMLSESIDETLYNDVAKEGTEELTNQVNNNGPLIRSTAQLEKDAVRASSGDVSLCTLSIAGALLLGVLKYS